MSRHIHTRLGPCFQKILDWAFEKRKRLHDALVYASLRLYGFEDLTFEDVKNGTSRNRTFKSLHLERAEDLDGLLQQARELHRATDARRSTITEKTKTLLTVSSILLSISGLILPKELAFDRWWMQGLFLLAAFFLVNTITLLMTYFNVGIEVDITLDQSDVDSAPEVRTRALINNYGLSTVTNDNRTDYLVNIYVVARCCFLCALALLAFLFVANQLLHSTTNRTKETIEELRSDPELIKLLRGPQGEKGDRGEHGTAGQKGQRGDRGETGPKGEKGDRGERGEAGAQGPKGEKGDAANPTQPPPT